MKIFCDIADLKKIKFYANKKNMLTVLQQIQVSSSQLERRTIKIIV